MDEYLFFQQHKKILKDTKSVISPQIMSSAKVPENNANFECAPVCSGFKIESEHQDVKFGQKPKVNLKDVEPSPPGEFQGSSELTADSMKDSLKMLSGNYKEQYASSGFPPKICTLILKELCANSNKLITQILDIGCGKGYVGEYLKHDGFMHISGMDCSKNLIQIAEEKKVYEKIEKIAVGEVAIDQSHHQKYDYVISSSMINNDGWDENVFHQMLDLVKMGGFLIFATKLNLTQENQYGPEMNKLSDQQFWKFITEHTFYRYDKLCCGHGKFSNKMVKIVAYQKTDHNCWLEHEAERLEEEERLRNEKQLAIDAKIQAKDAKLSGAQNDRKKRKMLQEKEQQMKLDEELKAQEEAKQAELKAMEDAKVAEVNKKAMAEKIKQKMKEAMWMKLKAAQTEEVARREALRLEVQKKLGASQKKEQPVGFNPGA